MNNFCKVSVTCFENGIEKKLSTEESKKIVKVSLLKKPAISVTLSRLTPDEIANHTKQSVLRKIAEPDCAPIRQYLLRDKTSKRKSTEMLRSAPKKAHTELVQQISKPKFVPAVKQDLKEGLIVLAWMRTYSAWPAKIIKLKKTTAHVYFYGDRTNGNVNLEKIGMIGENADLIRFNVKKSILNYRKAVAEVETLKKVPSHLSMLKVKLKIQSSFENDYLN